MIFAGHANMTASPVTTLHIRLAAYFRFPIPCLTLAPFYWSLSAWHSAQFPGGNPKPT